MFLGADSNFLMWESSDWVTKTIAETRSIINNNAPIPYATFTPQTTIAYTEGRVYYDSDENTFVIYNDESDVALNVGEEEYIKVRNNSGAEITDGQPVYISGAQGNLPTIALCDADAVATADLVALATHTIENNTTGYITISGLVRGINTKHDRDWETLSP